jgi:hypothetical protein
LKTKGKTFILAVLLMGDTLPRGSREKHPLASPFLLLVVLLETISKLKGSEQKTKTLGFSLT